MERVDEDAFVQLECAFSPSVLSQWAPYSAKKHMHCLLLALMMAACGFSAFAEDDYFPMHVGDEWTLPTKYVAADGKVLEGIFHQKIVDTIEKSGRIYFRLRTWSDGLTDNIVLTTLLRKDETAVYNLQRVAGNTVETIDAVLPLRPGKTWQGSVGTTTITYTVIAFETVAASGILYKNCCHIRSSISDGVYIEDVWEAPNMETVKDEVVYANGVKVTQMLELYKPGK